jgi:thymidylate synthase ThyX/thymidylate kinase
MIQKEGSEKSLNIYFAGSIRGGRDDVSLYSELISHLKNYGSVLSEHVGDKKLGAEGESNDISVHDRDLELIKKSDLFVAEVSLPSLGVGYEISFAFSMGKKILCLYKQESDKNISAMINGCKGAFVEKYNSIDEAKNKIDDFVKKNFISEKGGRLLVFEGTDCSGKSTQINLLIEKLNSEGRSCQTLDFPNYSTPTGKIVRRYLDGEFGEANSIPAKVASVFYAEDRFVSKPIIEESLKGVDFTILDRYVESNMGHQGGKIRDAKKREEFFEWNRNLEYDNFGLPKPDAVIFLYMPPAVSAELMKTRTRKSEFHPAADSIGDGHESNPEHMKNAAESYLHLARLYGWMKIDCAPDGTIKSLKTPEQIHEEIWEKVIEMRYSDEDRKVLNYFFTNLDRGVFASKNFHPEVWALMQGRYSRSKEGLRESFLQLLKEDMENYRMLVSEIDKTSGGEATRHATEKAIKFIEKWVLGYGHSSIAEGAVINLGIEGVSILATKVIEDNRLSSFCEKSTRYVSFDRSSFYVDEKLKNSEFYPEVKNLLDDLFHVYSELSEPVLKYVKSVAPIQEGTTPSAWERACASRRFDAVRYLLPACTKTSLGWTVNARELSHAITKLLSSPLKEMNDIGEAVKRESSKILPSLLKFSDKSNYFIKTENEMNFLAESINVSPSKKQEVVRLVCSPPKELSENILVASILYRYKSEPFEKIVEFVKKMSAEEKEGVVDSYLGNMSQYDYPMRELEHLNFSFDLIIDYGAFRDLQRHRMCSQTNQIFSSDLGFDIPTDIRALGKSFEEKYVLAMEHAKSVYEKVRKKYPNEAQYLLPLGFRKRFLLTMNLREIYHLIKLRTIPLAHESYRKIAYKIYEVMKKEYPLLSKYIVCNYSQEELGRLKSEEATEKRKDVVDW